MHDVLGLPHCVGDKIRRDLRPRGIGGAHSVELLPQLWRQALQFGTARADRIGADFDVAKTVACACGRLRPFLNYA